MLPRINHILYATDLSENARQTLGYAIVLADATASSLTVIHIIEETAPNAELMIKAFLGYSSDEEMQQQTREKITGEIKNRLREICDELGCQLPACRFALSDIIVDFGQPGERLLQEAESGSYDLLVAGRHDYGFVDTFLEGHSTKNLLQHCPIPILQVPLTRNNGLETKTPDAGPDAG